MKKKLINNKWLIASFFVIFFFTLLFPYSGDDWQWAVGELSIERIIGFSTNANLNGRYLGNIFVILLTKNILIRGIIMSLTLAGILHIISKKFNVNYLVIATALLLIPREIMKQSVVWSSGFANYTISTLFLLITLILIIRSYKEATFNAKLSVVNIILCFASSLFIENLTIGLLIFLFITNIVYIFKYKRININLLSCLIGSIIGTLTMFIHPAYFGVASGEDGYRNIPTDGGILERILSNLENYICPFAINNNIIIFIFIIGSLVFYINKNKKHFQKSKLINIALIYQVTYIIYSFIRMLNPNWMPVLHYSSYFYIITSALFIISLIIILVLIFKEKANNALIICFIIILLVAPLSIVSPLGARNFFMVYVLEVILLMEIIRLAKLPLKSGIIKNTILVTCITMFLFYINIYGYITYVNTKRENYVMEKVKQEEKKIVVPELPYSEYVWVANYSSDYNESIYKNYKKIPFDIEFNFIHYDVWTAEYDN